MELTSVTMCGGCEGCMGNLSDHDLAYELDLEAMMSERPDGNSGPPQSTVDVWHITPTRMVATPRGRAGLGSRHSGVRVRTRMDVERILGALGRARQ